MTDAAPETTTPEREPYMLRMDFTLVLSPDQQDRASAAAKEMHEAIMAGEPGHPDPIAPGGQIPLRLFLAGLLMKLADDRVMPQFTETAYAGGLKHECQEAGCTEGHEPIFALVHPTRQGTVAVRIDRITKLAEDPALKGMWEQVNRAYEEARRAAQSR
ncbi:MAG TPA: hypothetical protein VFE72_02865 [Lysobacter sp.]|nr:hypothetical protein [Lysobacter sp.]